MKCSLCCGTILRCMMNVGCKQSFPVLTWSSDVFVWSNLRSKTDTHWTSPSKTNVPTVHLIHSPVSPVSSESKIWWVFSSFSKKLCSPPIPDIPILSRHWPNWGINNPIISILLFYLYSFNSYSHLLLATDSSLWAMHQRTSSHSVSALHTHGTSWTTF